MSDVCEKCKEWRSPRTASCRWHLRTYPEAMPISCAGVRSLTPIFYAAFERHRPGAVIHFAAYVGEWMMRPLAYYRINVAGVSAF